ncbi:MAG: polysaccharide lyase [Gammaproteobacteria bacterium]|nr:polysaccharide lyase [Gammaproteobacteria bacterium]
MHAEFSKTLGTEMANNRARQPKKACTIAGCLGMFLAGSGVAAPVVQQASGTFDHKATITISGSGFGTKSTGAPVVWDDASGTKITDKWDGAWPSGSGAEYNTAYRLPQRSISLPHSHITKYIAGAGYPGTDTDRGWNVMFWKAREIPSFPAYSYMSWYQRADDKWNFSLGSPNDGNFKVWDYSTGTSPYDTAYWYLEYNPRPTSKTSTPSWHIQDDSFNTIQPNGEYWGPSAVNPMAGQWSKIELEIRYDNSSAGYMKVWENGVLKVNYKGKTDGLSGTQRNEAVGGYIRAYGGKNQWRYFADVYLDYTRARVVLANNQKLSSATIVESQIPISWSNTSIRISANLGKFSAGQTAYLFVVDSSGTPSATGLPVSVGDTASKLAPPTNLHVL